MSDLTLFQRDPELAKDQGPNEFAFIALSDIYNDRDTGALQDALKSRDLIGSRAIIHVQGEAVNAKDRKKFSFDLQSAVVRIDNANTVAGVVRALMRQEVKVRAGRESGVEASDWIYTASHVGLSSYVPPRKKPIKITKTIFRKIGGKWHKRVRGYTNAKGKKVKGYWRLSSRAEYLKRHG